MSHTRTYIAVSIQPDGARGITATRREDKGFAILRRGTVEWQPDGSAPGGLRGDLLRLLRDLHPDRHAPATLVVSLSPERVLWRHVDVPPAGRRETEEYLALWIDRHWPAARFGPMRWRYGAGDRRASLLLAGEDLISAIEGAATESRIDLAGCFPEVLCLAQLVDETEFRIAECGENDMALTHFAGRKFVDRQWAPASASALVVAEISASDVPVRLYGSKAGRVAQAAEIAVQDGYWPDRARETLPGSDVAETLFAGLFRCAVAEHPERLLNLAKREPRWRREATRVVAKAARLATWKSAAMLAVAVIVLLAAGGYLRNRLYASSMDAARAMSFDTVAAEKNIEIIEDLAAERLNVLAVLDGLREVHPKGAVLHTFSVDRKGTVSMTGVTNNFAAVESFTKTLSGSRWFRDAVTQSNDIVGDNQVKFSIRCRLRRRQ